MNVENFTNDHNALSPGLHESYMTWLAVSWVGLLPQYLYMMHSILEAGLNAKLVSRDENTYEAEIQSILPAELHINLVPGDECPFKRLYIWFLLRCGPVTTRWTSVLMITSSNENIFRVTGHLCGEFTGLRWIPSTKASDADLWSFLWYAPEWTVE